LSSHIDGYGCVKERAWICSLHRKGKAILLDHVVCEEKDHPSGVCFEKKKKETGGGLLCESALIGVARDAADSTISCRRKKS